MKIEIVEVIEVSWSSCREFETFVLSNWLPWRDEIKMLDRWTTS